MKKIVTLIIMTLAPFMVARSFDFSATVNGTTLYFTILSDGQSVKIVNPDWDMYPQPSGDITVPATVSHDGITYNITAVDKEAFRLCTSLTGISLPEGLKVIGTLAFMGCSSLSSIELPSTIDSIANEVFNGTAYLSNTSNWTDDGKTLYINNYLIKVRSTTYNAVTVQEGTKGIAGMALYYCRHIDSVSLPSTLQFIGPQAFADCDTLHKVQLLTPTPPRLADDSFEHIANLSVYVPCGSSNNYSAASYWNLYTIEEYGCDTTSTDTTTNTDTTSGYAPFPFPWWPFPHPHTGIDDVSSTAINIATTADGLSISNAIGETIAVYDISGRLIAQKTGSEVTNIELTVNGIYIVKIGLREARKIIYFR